MADVAGTRGSDSAHIAEGSLPDFTRFFKAFCNGTRMTIVEQLLSGERCVCEITALLKMSQPLVSHHLAILKEAGFVRSRGEGARTYYSISWDVFSGELERFAALTADLHARDTGRPAGPC